MTAFSALLSRLRGFPTPRGGRRSAYRPVLEKLEERLAPAVYTIAPQADAYVNSGLPNTNAGASTHLYTEATPVDSYLRFAVTGTSGPVQSAKLRLYVLGGASAGPAVYTSGTSWSEMAITWNNRPARTSAALGQLGAVASNTWIEFDVTSAVTGNGTYSFDLAKTIGSSIQMSSREGVKPPQLVVTTLDAAAPPSAPGNLTAIGVSASQVNLTWTDNSGNETGFKVERSTDGVNFTQVALVSANVIAYGDTGLAAGTKYYYRVRATNAAGDSAYSNVASATTQTAALPAAPSNLTAAAISPNEIDLTWTANSSNATGFKVERSTDGTTFTQIATVGGSVTTYKNTGLTGGTQYYYRVRANNAAGDSAYSNVSSATTPVSQSPPAAPSNLTANAASANELDLTWTANSSNATGFKVERSTDGTTFTQIATVAGNVTTYANTGLAAGTKYYYRVRASNAAGDSAYSNVANGTTPASQAVGPVTSLHYAPNANFVNGQYVPAQDGFNLADASSVSEVNSLPAGCKALVWIGMGDGVTSAFISAVQPFIGNPKVYGFYLYDEPDPTGQYGPLVTASSLKAESDWIHTNDPGAKTFIVLMNLGSDTNPSFANTYNPANTGIDLYGIDPYPVQGAFNGANYSIIPAAVAAAEAWGIPQSQIVPVYQAFGGGGYSAWTLPTASQEQQILATWASVVPQPAFDYAYSWGIQSNDSALVNTPALQSVFAAHNAAVPVI